MQVGQEQSDHQRDRRGDPHGGIKTGHANARGPFGIAGRLPFQKSFARDHLAQQGPADGIQADESVVRQKGQRDKDLAELTSSGPGHSTKMHRPRQVSRFLKRIGQRRQQSRKCDNRDDQQRSKAAKFRQKQPVAQHQEHQGSRDETAPQVVENLPLGQHGKRVGDASGVSARNPRQEPLRYLPVAANPTVAPVNVHLVAGRMFLVELHVADEGRTGMTRFQQIVAENCIFRKATLHGTLEGIHVVDSFSDEGAFLENILVHVGDLPGVWINASVAGEKPDEPGSSGARQTDPDAWLQNAVTFFDNPVRCIEHRPVQRMGHRPDELPGGVTRQLGVGVERDHVFDGGQDGGLSDDLGKAITGTAAQQRVELCQLSAFAFVTHPKAFAGVPAARAMKQEKQVLPDGRVFAVQLFDSGPRPLQQQIVSRQGLGGCVAKICQQGEVKMLIPVGKMMNLQCLDEAIHAIQTGEHGGNGHDRAAVRRDAGGKIQSWKRVGLQQQRGEPVHHRHGQLAGTQQEYEGKENEFPTLNFKLLGLPHKPEGGRHGERPDATRIERQWKAVNAPFHDPSPGPPHVHLTPQHKSSLVDQIKADVGCPVSASLLPGAGLGQMDGLSRHVRFRDLAVPGKELDRMTIAIAGRKIHRAINISRVGAQSLLHKTQALHEVLPVHCTQETKAGNAVADRNLVGRLALTLQVDQLLDGQPLFNEPLFEPVTGEMQHRTLSRQALAEFRHERAGDGKIGFRHVRHNDDEVRRVLLRHILQPVHPQVGQIAMLPREYQPGGDALHVFNQPQAQHDRDGPQLAQLQ